MQLLFKISLKRKITKNIFDKVEKVIGSDLRLFFHKQGYLENLKQLKLQKKSRNYFFYYQALT